MNYYLDVTLLHLFYVGLNDCGQLGLGDTATRRHPTLVPLPAEVTAASTSSVGKKRKGSDEEGGGEYPAGVRVLKVATGHQHTLVLFSNGQVRNDVLSVRAVLRI